MIQSRICDLLGISYPIFQGGMSWVSDGVLAAAVSEGGGLGIISAGNLPVEEVRKQIHVAAAKTDRPFGVNIMLKSPHVEEVAAAVAEEHVAVVTTGAGSPARFMHRWQAAGCKVIPVIPSVAIAKKMTQAGAAALIAEGCESGGHIGKLTTMALIPQVCDCTDLPVLAAGGIADGRGMAAAMMLGACGVQMGTRFLTALECSIHPNYKEKVLAASDLSTTVTGERLGHPVRCLRSAFTLAYEQAEASGLSDEELEQMGVGVLRLAAQNGDLEHGCFIAGQIAGLVRREQPAAEILREVAAEAESLLCCAPGVVW